MKKSLKLSDFTSSSYVLLKNMAAVKFQYERTNDQTKLI